MQRMANPRACSNTARYALRTPARKSSLSTARRSASGTALALNPRWLSDLDSRIKALGANARGEDAERLRKTSDYLDSHWLALSAGREGFLTEERWRGLDKFGVAWGDMVTFTGGEMRTSTN
ncbi:hypothetical protein EsDP_00005035 [Epichloe bromicola]|uniref:Uncharacterized protein n=1 Tax=Epichloe bromicola TaxID=79588 RepID=A0ABQ0CTG1_9HYPO